MKNKQLPAKTADPWVEIAKLHKRLNKAKNPDPKDVERLRLLAVQTTGFLSANSITQLIRQQLIEKISHGVSRAYMLAEVDVLKKQLEYDAAPPLERLLIDHILTLRLRLIHAENAYNIRMVNEANATFKMGEYWDNLLSSAQARFIRAIEALARVRRLARNTPALQINIAHEGGKQVNVQGDVNGKKAAPAAPVSIPPPDRDNPPPTHPACL
jgi:hypothetical protein